MPYIYSNWNRRQRKSLIKRILGWVITLPFLLGRKLSSYLNLTNKRKTKNFLIRAALYIAAGLLLLGSFTFAVVALNLPDPNKLSSRIIPQSTKIYARDGTTLLYEIHGEAKRTLVDPQDLPAYVAEASIAVEDKNFYKNHGIDWKGILRAIFKDVTSASLNQGGSTITQQFVRNAILTREKTLTRKVKEIVLAIEIEQKYSKNEILKLYLNEIPYGQNAYGVEAAAETYFGKHAYNVTLTEAAYLAALPQAPSFYNPNGPNRDKLDLRKNYVLDQLFEQGYVTAQQRDQAKNEKVVFNKIKDNILAPHFVLYVQQLLASKYGEKTLEEGGLSVVTTLDWNLQQIAEQAIKDGVLRNEKYNKASNAALVATDPKTGQILAMVGSRDYFDDAHDGQVNVTVRERQPGSSIKPYIYAAAFKQGMSPATMLVDVKTVFGTYAGKEYAPDNYDGQSHGIVSMRKALAGSLNIPAVKTLALTGVADAIGTAKDIGITSDISADRCGLALVLGGCEVKLLDHVSAMGVFGQGGIKHDQVPILKITDSGGNTLEDYHDVSTEVLDPQIAYEIVSILIDNDSRSFIFGAKSPLILPDRVVAAKTGTTQGWRDGWTIGFTPSLSAGVWVGNNDFTPMRQGADGVVVAAPIWNQFMRGALKDTPPEQFFEPAGIQHILVDSLSGKLPTPYTPETKTEVFASSSIPKDFDNVHVPVKINKLNGKKATNQTPPDLLETRVFTVIYSEESDNPNWEAPVRAWALSHGYEYPPTELDDGSVNPTFLQSQIKFITPTNNQEIKSLPLTVQIDTGNNSVQSVQLSLEGEYIGQKTSSPYNFTITSTKNGWQTLTATVILPAGNRIQNSVRINVNLSPP